MATAPTVKNFKRHLKALFTNNDGGLADVTFTLKNGDKLYLHRNMLINVPDIRDDLLHQNGKPLKLAWTVSESPAAVVAFFAHIYGAPVEEWCVSWFNPRFVHRFPVLYDLAIDRGAPELRDEIFNYLHARLNGDFKRGTVFSASKKGEKGGGDAGWIWVLTNIVFPNAEDERGKAALRWEALQSLVLRVLWKRGSEIEPGAWLRGMEMCEGFAIALRAHQWICRPRGPGSGVSVA